MRPRFKPGSGHHTYQLLTNRWYSGCMSSYCVRCNKPTARRSYLYCSNKCQHDQQYDLYIKNWKQGLVDGNRGIKTRVLSNHLRRYLLEKNDEKCSKCGWNQVHPLTNKPPLEVNHKDGNAENNDESNLQLLCPNCHSLTNNFRNHNKGKGRKWR